MKDRRGIFRNFSGRGPQPAGRAGLNSITTPQIFRRAVRKPPLRRILDPARSRFFLTNVYRHLPGRRLGRARAGQAPPLQSVLDCGNATPSHAAPRHTTPHQATPPMHCIPPSAARPTLPHIAIGRLGQGDERSCGGAAATGRPGPAPHATTRVHKAARASPPGPSMAKMAMARRQGGSPL